MWSIEKIYVEYLISILRLNFNLKVLKKNNLTWRIFFLNIWVLIFELLPIVFNHLKFEMDNQTSSTPIVYVYASLRGNQMGLIHVPISQLLSNNCYSHQNLNITSSTSAINILQNPQGSYQSPTQTMMSSSLFQMSPFLQN